MLLTGAAHAQFVWTGFLDQLFENPLNWEGLAAPPSSVNDDIIFSGDNVRINPLGLLADVAVDHVDIGVVLFEGSDSFGIRTLLGTSSFSFIDGGGLVNNSTALQTLDIDIVGTGDTLIINAAMGDFLFQRDIHLGSGDGVALLVNGTGTTTVDGTIIGGDGVVVLQSGTLELNANNNSHGGTELAGGTLVLGHNGALGTGQLVVTGDGNLESALGESRTVSNEVFLFAELTVSGTENFLQENIDLGGALAGAGGLVMSLGDFEDELRLDGNNSFTGGTTLMSGTLVLGHVNALGSGGLTVAGDSGLRVRPAVVTAVDTDITLEAELTITGGNDLGLSGDLSGSGSLNMHLDNDGTGLLLGGDNTYTGGTTLTRGTLILASDTALGAVSGGVTVEGDSTLASTSERTLDHDLAINNFATLTFAGPSSLTLNGDVTGSGGLTVDFDLPNLFLRLTGASSYVGPTTVDNGVLEFDNASLFSAVTVNNGGTVSGSATIDNSLTLNGGGTYRAMIDGDTGTADLLDLTGSATLQAGSIIEAALTGTGYVASGQSFTIIDADGGVTDNGVNFMDTSATLTISLVPSVTANTYDVMLTRAANAYSTPANPGNNKSVGFALDSLIPVADTDPDGPAGDLLGQLDSFTDPAYNQALTELSPKPYRISTDITLANTSEFTQLQTNYMSSRRTIEGISAASVIGPAPGSLALSNDDPFIVAAALAQADAARTPPPGRAYEWESSWGGYAEVLGILLDQDTTPSRTGFSGNSIGGQFGLDYTFEGGLLLGVAFGYLGSDTNLDAAIGEIDQDMYRIGPYLSWYAGDWYIDASLSFGFSTNESTRNIPALGLTAKGDYDSYDLTGYVGTGYRFEVGENLYVAPIGSVLYSYIDLDGFTETGAGGANLTLPSRNDDTLRTRLGANLSYRFVDVGWQPVVYGYGGWEYEVLDNNDNITAQFAAGGNPFTIDLGSRGRNAFFGGLGIDALVYETLAAYFRAEVVGSSESIGVGLAGGLRWAF